MEFVILGILLILLNRYIAPKLVKKYPWVKNPWVSRALIFVISLNFLVLFGFSVSSLIWLLIWNLIIDTLITISNLYFN